MTALMTQAAVGRGHGKKIIAAQAAMHPSTNIAA
jgi:hypothetical protein